MTERARRRSRRQRRDRFMGDGPRPASTLVEVRRPCAFAACPTAPRKSPARCSASLARRRRQDRQRCPSPARSASETPEALGRASRSRCRRTGCDGEQKNVPRELSQISSPRCRYGHHALPDCHDSIWARRIPPSALMTTTTSGGVRQTVRSTKPTSAIAKSPGALTDVVQTGL